MVRSEFAGHGAAASKDESGRGLPRHLLPHDVTAALVHGHR